MLHKDTGATCEIQDDDKVSADVDINRATNPISFILLEREILAVETFGDDDPVQGPGLDK